MFLELEEHHDLVGETDTVINNYGVTEIIKETGKESDTTEVTPHTHPRTPRAQLLQSVRLFETPWMVAYQALLFMGLSRKNTGVGSHFLLQGSSPLSDQT